MNATDSAPDDLPVGRKVEELVDSPLWAAAPDGLAIIDAEGVIRASNAMFDEIFLYDEGELEGRPLDILIPDRHRGSHDGLVGRYHTAPRRRTLLDGGRLEGKRSDGAIVSLLISLSPVDTDDGVLVVAGVRDVSDWVKAERRVAASTQRQLLAEEHERIARDLHDTVIQELYGIGMALQLAVRGLEGPIAELIDATVDRLDGTIATIRDTISDFQAPVSGRSFRAEVLTMAADATPALSAPPVVSLSGPIDLLDLGAEAADLRTDALAVLREALSNVVRHADASTVDVSVRIADGELCIEVIDDGVGPDPNGTRRSGLANLEARAARHNGTFDFGVHTPNGAAMKWSVPLDGASGDRRGAR